MRNKPSRAVRVKPCGAVPSPVASDAVRRAPASPSGLHTHGSAAVAEARRDSAPATGMFSGAAGHELPRQYPSTLRFLTPGAQNVCNRHGKMSETFGVFVVMTIIFAWALLGGGS